MLLASSVHVWPQLRMWFQLLLHVYRVAVHGLVATCRDDGIGSSTLSLGLTIKPVGDRRSIASLYLQCSPCFISLLAFKLLFSPIFFSYFSVFMTSFHSSLFTFYLHLVHAALMFFFFLCVNCFCFSLSLLCLPILICQHFKFLSLNITYRVPSKQIEERLKIKMKIKSF